MPKPNSQILTLALDQFLGLMSKNSYNIARDGANLIDTGFHFQTILRNQCFCTGG